MTRKIGRPPRSENAVQPTIMAVEKAFALLTSFDASNPTMSLTQLASVAGLGVSTTQRFANTLEKLGYLYRDPGTKRFELGVRSLDLGHRFNATNRIIERASPHLFQLSRATDETANVSILDDTEVVFVLRFMSRHMLNTTATAGSRYPAYCTAPGVAMLARLPEEQRRDLLDRSDLRAFTPFTTFRIEDLDVKFAAAGQRGYATAFQEFFMGDLSIAAAITDPRGLPIGAVNIAVSAARYTAEEAEARFAPMVVETAALMSLR